MKKILLTIISLALLISGGMYANALLKVDTSEPVIKVSSLQKGLVLHMPLDEESEKVGSDIFDGWDFTSGWSVVNSTINDADTFTANAANGGIYRTGILTIGTKYRIVIAGTVSVGAVSINSTTSNTILGSGFGTHDFTADENGLVIRATTNGAVIDVTTLKLVELRTADKTPYSNNGTLYGTDYTTDRMGQSNRAMSFNGTSDYVDVGDPSSELFDFGANDSFTICTWVNLATSPPTYQHIIDKNNDGAFGYYIRGLVGKLQVHIRDALSNSASVVTDGSMADGNWNFTVLKVDRAAQLMYLYVDNVLIGSIDCSSVGALNANTSLKIGRSKTTYYTKGNIADVRIYNRALSTDEITQLYEQYRPKLSAGSLQKGLVLDMPLTSGYTKDETAGSEVMTDRTPYSNDGQNTGGDVDTDHTTFISANSDYVRIADSASLSPTSAMTAVVWVKGAAQAGKAIFNQFDGAANQRSFLMYTNGISPYNKLKIIVSDDGTVNSGHRKSYESSLVAFDSTWHLIGFTFDAGTLKLFVDGVEDTNSTKTNDDAITTIHNSTADVTIGSYLNSDVPTSFFSGDLAKARIYNRALTADEMLLIYDKEKGGF